MFRSGAPTVKFLVSLLFVLYTQSQQVTLQLYAPVMKPLTLT